MFQTARGVSNLYGFLERCFPTLRLVKHKNPVKATKLWKPGMNPGEAVKEATTNKYYSLGFFAEQWTVQLSNDLYLKSCSCFLNQKVLITISEIFLFVQFMCAGHNDKLREFVQYFIKI